MNCNHFSRITHHASLFLSLALILATASAQPTNQTYPIDLPTVLRLANARNLDIQIARARLTEAQANRDSSLELFFPWISPGAGFRRHEGRIQDVTGNVFDTDKQSYTAGGTFIAQLDLGDAIYKSLAAKQRVHAADYALESQRNASALAAALGYHDLANARALMDVVEEALNISREYQRQLRDAVAAGIAFKGDELRVQVQTERYQLALRQAREKEQVASARLAEVIHLDSSVELVPLDVSPAPLTLVPTNAALDSLVNLALRARPELKESHALVSAARDSKNGAVYGPLIPSIGGQAFLGGLGGGVNEGTGNFGSSEDYAVMLGWRIGPGGLFDVGRTRATKAHLEIAQLTETQLNDQITRQVVESHVRLHSLLDQIGAARQTLELATATLRLSRERKQFGIGAVLEDIQAQQEVTRARSDYLTAVTDYNKTQHTLQHALGGPPKIEPP